MKSGIILPDNCQDYSHRDSIFFRSFKNRIYECLEYVMTGAAGIGLGYVVAHMG